MPPVSAAPSLPPAPRPAPAGARSRRAAPTLAAWALLFLSSRALAQEPLPPTPASAWQALPPQPTLDQAAQALPPQPLDQAARALPPQPLDQAARALPPQPRDQAARALPLQPPALGPRAEALPPRPPALSPGAEAYLIDKGRFLGVLAGWSALSLGSGVALWTQGDRFGRYAGIQFVAWGAANGILAGVGLSQLPDERASLRGGASLAEKRGKFRRALLVNALADAAYIGAGALLYGLGKNDAVRGTGAGFVAQGAFLLAFDNAGVLSFP